MALDPALLEILVCPECKTPVQLVRDGAGLQCGTCHRIYPVKDGIPVMLVDEAQSLEPSEAERLSARVVAEGIPPTFEPTASAEEESR